MLTRCVNISHSRPDRNTIQVRNAICEQSAFNAGVYRLNGCINIEQFLVCCENGIFDDRMGIVSPAGVIAVGYSDASGKFDDAGDLLDNPPLLCSDRTADGVRECQLVLLELHDTEVRGRLHKSGHIYAHCLHTVGKCNQNRIHIRWRTEHQVL